MGIPVLCSYSKMLFQEHFEVDPNLALNIGEKVVLDTRRGLEVGRVAAAPGTTKLRREEAMAGKLVRKAAGEAGIAQADLYPHVSLGMSFLYSYNVTQHRRLTTNNVPGIGPVMGATCRTP